MTAAKRIEYLADNEDGVSWFGRDGVSRRGARREFAGLIDVRPWPWRFTVKAEHMRPFDVTDCPAPAHGRDDDGELRDEDCRCDYQEDEGWMYVCAADHPEAIAAWRVEDYCAPRWVWRLRHRRAKLYRSLRREGHPVLWGGAPERRVNRFDRLIAGKGIALVLLRSRQLRIGESEWRWCEICGAVRPHWMLGRAPHCRAAGHFDMARKAYEPRP